MWWYDYIIEKALMKNSSLIENASITYKTIIVFAVMGLISGLLMMALSSSVSLTDYPATREVYDRLIPGLVFGTILYATLRYYRLIAGKHWISFLILVLTAVLGWYLASKIAMRPDLYPTSKSIKLAGFFGAFCVAIPLLWVCEIHKDKNNRGEFVIDVSVFGIIGAFIYTMIDPSNQQPGLIFPIWQSMVFMSIPISFFYCRWINKLTNTFVTGRVKKRVIEIKNQAVKAVERGEPFKKK